MNWAVVLTVAVGLAYMWALAEGPTFGRFLGYTEEWHKDCDLRIRERFFNGRRTYHVLFVPVFRTGFMHSTIWIDD